MRKQFNKNKDSCQNCDHWIERSVKGSLDLGGLIKWEKIRIQKTDNKIGSNRFEGSKQQSMLQPNPDTTTLSDSTYNFTIVNLTN